MVKYSANKDMKKLLYIALFCGFIGFSDAAPFNPPRLNQHRFSISREDNKRIRECLRNEEFRWAIICEHYGLLTHYYPATHFGGSTGMVKINGKNCTPYGAGTGGASFIGADGNEYNFNHARHMSCPDASEMFHLAQYYLFFTNQGKTVLRRYNNEINLLMQYN
jgi:hypothetical protein